MTSPSNQPPVLRLAAAVILGCITGAILFLIIALGIGMINERMQMNIPINLLIAENIFSTLLLAVLIIAGILFFYNRVRKTESSDL